MDYRDPISIERNHSEQNPGIGPEASDGYELRSEAFIYSFDNPCGQTILKGHNDLLLIDLYPYYTALALQHKAFQHLPTQPARKTVR